MAIEQDQAVRLVESLVSLLRVSRTFSHRAAQLSVSGTPIALLRLVRDTDPRLGDLAEQLMVKPSVASRAVAALEADGYVTRITDPADARACRIHLTDAGRGHLQEREDHVLRMVTATFADWTPDDAEQSARLLKRIEGTVVDFMTHIEHAAADADSAELGPDPTSDLTANTAQSTTHSNRWEKTAV